MNIEKTNYYVGVGSNAAPDYIQDLMTETAKFLYSKNYVLRTMGNTVSDKAFKAGSLNKVEHYTQNQILTKIPDRVYEIASSVHPTWDKCTEEVKKYHAMNALIIYGKDLKTFVEFVICWTPRAKLFGGPGMICRIAQSLDIPVFNLAKMTDRCKILSKIKKE